MKARSGVIALLILLFTITYLDRVCISVAGPRMQEELGIDPIGWGWVTGIFTLSYCIFQIPSGLLGDRVGPRRVLAAIVLWWSAFTALTAKAATLPLLLITRFAFGAGEAGVFPNSSIVVTRWFPPEQRATLSGVTLMASQIGGGLAPLLVVPIQLQYGWRASFYIFASLGVLWSIVWYAWFRDRPAVNAPPVRSAASRFHWGRALANTSVLAALGTSFSYAYVYNFFQTWFHTFLIKGRGFTETGLLLSAAPYVLAICTNLFGGILSDKLVKRMGPRRGRQILGVICLALSGLFTLGAMASRQPLLTVALLALVYGGITFQQAGMFGVTLDIGGSHAGAIVGLMNMAAQAGGLVGAVAYGYIVQRSGSYEWPFIPMALFLFLGAALWLKIDASKPLESEPTPTAP